MTQVEQLAIIVSLLDVQDEIVEILKKHHVNCEHGEALLLYMAGVAAGACQRPIINNNWGNPALLGWKHGASWEPMP